MVSFWNIFEVTEYFQINIWNPASSNFHDKTTVSPHFLALIYIYYQWEFQKSFGTCPQLYSQMPKLTVFLWVQVAKCVKDNCTSQCHSSLGWMHKPYWMHYLQVIETPFLSNSIPPESPLSSSKCSLLCDFRWTQSKQYWFSLSSSPLWWNEYWFPRNHCGSHSNHPEW